MVGAFVLIAVVVDISENIDDLMESEASFTQIVTQYYIPFSFYFGNLLSPFLVFLTIIWFTSKMAQKTEIVAILSGGVSFNRMLRPFLIAGSLLAVVMLLASQYFVPLTHRIRYNFKKEYLGKGSSYNVYLHRELQSDTIYYAHYINEDRGVLYKFSIDIWQDGELKEIINSVKAKQDTVNDSWTLTQYQRRTFDEDGTGTLVRNTKMDTTINMQISEFGWDDDIIMNMNYFQISDHLQREKDRGSEKVAHIEIEKHTRTANAFSIIVLTFIGVSIASRKTRGGMGVHLLFAVIIAFTYIFSSRMAAVAATNMGVTPSLAVWIPNFIFLIVGYIIYRMAPK